MATRHVLEFDPSVATSFGHYKCPECDAQFYGGGPAAHYKGCKIDNYVGCIYVIGPRVVEEAKKWAEHKKDNDANMPLCPLSLSDILEQLPDKVQ